MTSCTRTGARLLKNNGLDLLLHSAHQRLQLLQHSPATQHRQQVRQREGNLTRSVLTLEPEYRDDGKKLTCRAENTEISDGALQDSTLLTVYCESNINKYQSVSSLPSLLRSSDCQSPPRAGAWLSGYRGVQGCLL